ncbi:MAG: flagellar FliJ family protein [Alphaproteobacteria bacterium]|nr:flagellar FliJ family protein [Alphaproteobacteria bacterium]
MSALSTLIRANRWKIDEQRRQLGELERLAERLREESVRLEQELTSEQQVAAASLEAGYSYPGYARELIERRRKLANSLAEVEGQMTTAREALAEAFREMKRYEITAANRMKRERIAAERRQRIAQDEVAMQTFRRRAASSD